MGIMDAACGQFAKTEQSEEKLSAVQAMADAAVRQAEASALQESLDQAEQQYLQALRCWEQLFRLTGTQTYADAARDTCAALADICMQQGNMHGADAYYGRILCYPAHQSDTSCG